MFRFWSIRPLLSAALVALVLAFASLTGVDAAASERIVLAQDNGMSLEQAVNSVQRQYGGRIVSAHTEVRGNREVHVVKVLTKEGRVRTVTVPGRQLRRN